jgi:hypothetical protein
MKPKKQKSVWVLAEAFVAKFGSAPGSRESEFMAYAFRKGYASAKRRCARSNNPDQQRDERSPSANTAR